MKTKKEAWQDIAIIAMALVVVALCLVGMIMNTHNPIRFSILVILGTTVCISAMLYSLKRYKELS